MFFAKLKDNTSTLTQLASMLVHGVVEMDTERYGKITISLQRKKGE
jgi:hypothetical protein